MLIQLFFSSSFFSPNIFLQSFNNIYTIEQNKIYTVYQYGKILKTDRKSGFNEGLLIFIPPRNSVNPNPYITSVTSGIISASFN